MENFTRRKLSEYWMFISKSLNHFVRSVTNVKHYRVNSHSILAFIKKTFLIILFIFSVLTQL
ncbi:hypothetical protein GARC_1282 [Paraglaciecola arctica BSs20135]|uniref:Uncharacterized protein n=1 Tax=Paraglaciecola arctica BSs20135 TaxID=493475 RepID=K6YJA9_9ALTE|nr:hypothetical protein GARC_1282 [Paraglaciecola arctica BSs20135]